MPTYKGNVGNLMQHWTLCKLLEVVQQQGVPGLNFIDAHAMAPLAQTRQSRDYKFDFVRNRLPGQESVYENAWHVLRQQHRRVGYPNSANFVQQVWPGDFSLLLCETRPVTVRNLKDWCRQLVQSQPNRYRAKSFHCDWRDRFGQWLADPGQMELLPGSLTLVSFDPYKYDTCRGHFTEGSSDLYPQDIELIHNLLRNLDGQILIQLSTYNTPQGNPQNNVIAQVGGVLKDFERAAVVRVPARPMMSLVYSRGLDDNWLEELRGLPCGFTSWLQMAAAIPVRGP